MSIEIDAFLPPNRSFQALTHVTKKMFKQAFVIPPAHSQLFSKKGICPDHEWMHHIEVKAVGVLPFVNILCLLIVISS
jgi:hypothetical protein